ncbi:MAG: phosphoribosylanthranilate isomerase, partial [Calditrichaeota bacterium]
MLRSAEATVGRTHPALKGLSSPWPWIQIAGIHDLEEALLIHRCGVSYLGFPLALPVHREDCSAEQVARITAALPQTARPVLITYLQEAERIIALAEQTGIRIIQLHGAIGRDALIALRHRCPDWFLIKSLIVGRDPVEVLEKQVSEFSPLVDAFITDSFDPASGAEGATGRVHDWTISRRLVQISPRPVILAGGLRPENVARAIRVVRPAGV